MRGAPRRDTNGLVAGLRFGRVGRPMGVRWGWGQAELEWGLAGNQNWGKKEANVALRIQAGFQGGFQAGFQGGFQGGF